MTPEMADIGWNSSTLREGWGLDGVLFKIYADTWTLEMDGLKSKLLQQSNIHITHLAWTSFTNCRSSQSEMRYLSTINCNSHRRV